MKLPVQELPSSDIELLSISLENWFSFEAAIIIIWSTIRRWACRDDCRPAP